MFSFWLLAAYSIGTLFGIVVGAKIGYRRGTDKLLAMLIDGGYIQYKKSDDGNLHIAKIGE